MILGILRFMATKILLIFCSVSIRIRFFRQFALTFWAGAGILHD